MYALVYGSIVGQNEKGIIWMSRGVLGLIYFNISSIFMIKILLVFEKFRKNCAEEGVGIGWYGAEGSKKTKL